VDLRCSIRRGITLLLLLLLLLIINTQRTAGRINPKVKAGCLLLPPWRIRERRGVAVCGTRD
jgi:hypothetical protein